MSKLKGTQAVATGLGHYARELQGLGLTRSKSYKIGNLINRWLDARGPNGCLDYLDSLGECIKSYLYNTPRPSTKVWVNVDKDGFPLCLSFIKKGTKRSSLKRIACLKRLVRIKNPTRNQLKKFVDAVTGLPAKSSCIDGVLNVFVRPGMRHFRRKSKERFTRTGCYLGLYPIKAIGKCKDKSLNHSTFAAQMFFKDILHLEPLWENPAIQEFYTKAIKEVVHESWVPNTLHDFVDMVRSGNSTFDKVVPDPYVGNIGLQQEPGGKLRCFASPKTIYQVVFTPLFRMLEELLLQIPEDCTKDQSKGAEFALEQLRLGHTVHSIDLSNATDRFPYELQRKVLQGFNVPESLLQVLDFCVKGKWKAPKSMGGSLSWSQGQPLGLLPSFSMFALTHHFLIRGIYLKLGITDFDYRILGDDVVIVNDRVAQVYKEVLPQLGIEISQSKSYDSNCYAEFAGYQIDSQELFRPGKFREVTNENLIDKLTQAEDPYAYLPKGLIEPALLDVAFPYGLRAPTDEELSRYPLETLRVIYDQLKVRPKEYILHLEIRHMLKRFLITQKGGSHEETFMNVYNKVKRIEGIVLDWEHDVPGPIGLCMSKLNELIYGAILCTDDRVKEIKDALRIEFPEVDETWSRLRLAKFISMLYPSFDVSTTSMNKRINQLARIQGMEFSVGQLNRLLQKAAFSKERSKSP